MPAPSRPCSRACWASPRKSASCRIPIRKEQNGYLINTLIIVPWCMAAVDLLVRGVSDHESIDRTWMIALQTAMGPFAMMDRMGLGVVHEVAKPIGDSGADPRAREYARYVEEHYLEHGRLGVAAGEGFYRYPHPGVCTAGLRLGERSRSDRSGEAPCVPHCLVQGPGPTLRSRRGRRRRCRPARRAPRRDDRRSGPVPLSFAGSGRIALTLRCAEQPCRGERVGRCLHRSGGAPPGSSHDLRARRAAGGWQALRRAANAPSQGRPRRERRLRAP